MFFTFLINEKNRRDKMTNILNQRGSITIEPTDIKSMIQKYSGQISAHKFYSLDEMDRLL